MIPFSCSEGEGQKQPQLIKAENDALRQLFERFFFKVIRPMGHIAIDVKVNIKKGLHPSLLSLHHFSANDGQVVQIWCGGSNQIIC